MFTIRPYAEKDAAACGECMYEGFFTAPVEDCDKILLRDYAQVLIEKCNFTYVAETDEGQVVCVVSAANLHRQLAALGSQFLHVLPQFGGEGRFVQIEPQDQRRGHPGEHSMELGEHVPSEQ